MPESDIPQEVLDIAKRYGKILAPLIGDGAERLGAIGEVIDKFNQQMAQLVETKPSDKTGVDLKIAAAYFYGAGANVFYAFGQDIREAHQRYTMTISQYVDVISRLLEDLRPFDPIYTHVVWESTFGGDKLLTTHRELLKHVQAFSEGFAECPFTEEHHVRYHQSAAEEIDNIIRELTYYVRYLLRLGIQAHGGDLSQIDS